MPELGSSGSVRGVSSNGHPYRDPGPIAVIARRRLQALPAPYVNFSIHTTPDVRPVRLIDGQTSLEPPWSFDATA